MANKPNEGSMPAEQGDPSRGGMMDDRDRERRGDDVRGIGDRDEESEDAEDTEEAEDAEDTEENEEGSF